MITRFFNKIISLTDHLMSGLLTFIKWFNLKKSIIFILIIIVLGQFVNYYVPFKHFHIYQILVIPAVIIASWAIKQFIVDANELSRIVASHPIKFVIINFLKLVSSNWSLPGLAIIGGLYIYASIKLHYIEFNLSGYYALLMIVLMLGTAIIGQTMYVYYIILLSKLKAENEFKYNFYFPAKTDWIVKLAKTGRMLNNSFFVLGFIYTLVFYINVPDGAIKIINDTNFDNWLAFIKLSTPDNLIFSISWITIFIIIIIAFPTYYIIQKNYIKTLVRKLKDKSISEVQKLMSMQEILPTKNIETELKYLTLINNIENSRNNPLTNYNVIPILSSIGTICVHFIRISESIL